MEKKKKDCNRFVRHSTLSSTNVNRKKKHSINMNVGIIKLLKYTLRKCGANGVRMNRF